MGIGALKVPFLVKLTKMPLVNLGLTKIQTRSESSQNDIFHAFTSNPSYSKIFVKFDLMLTLGGTKTLILIQLSERVEANAIVKII